MVTISEYEQQCNPHNRWNRALPMPKTTEEDEEPVALDILLAKMHDSPALLRV